MISTVEEVAALVDEVRASPARRDELVALLDEAHPVYQDRAAAVVVQVRGWVLQAFAGIGLPPAALPHVLEELESGHDAYLVAAAARALRGAPAPAAELARYLAGALGNIRGRDDLVSFEALGAVARPGRGTTATGELLETLAWLEASARIEASEGPPGAGCCDPPWSRDTAGQVRSRDRARVRELAALELEDHAGRAVRYGDFFSGRPAIVAFFYTRCTNPRKCSLTVARLARLQRRLEAAGLAGRVRMAAITYDAAYDTAARLRSFGAARGLRLDDDHRMLRAPAGIEPLRRGLGLGVGLVGALVNRHRIELFVLDARGRVAASFVRLAWSEDEVLARVTALLAEDAGPRRVLPRARGSAASASRAALAVLPPLALVFFPKCPLCWAAYLSALGVAGLERIPYAPWLVPLFIALVLVNVLVAWRRARRRRAMASFYLSAAGAFFLLVPGLALGVPLAAPIGVAASFAGAVLGSLRPRAVARSGDARVCRSGRGG